VVGPALCLIDLSAGPDPDVLCEVDAAETVSRIGHLSRNLHRAGIPDAPMRAWPRICKIPVEGRNSDGGGWAVETLCVWMWIPSRTAGIVPGAVVGVGQGVDELADGRTDLAAEAKRLGDFVRRGGAEPVPAAAGR